MLIPTPFESSWVTVKSSSVFSSLVSGIMKAVTQWVSRKTPGENPVVPTTTPRGLPSVEEKVDLMVDASRENREEEEEKTRITPNGLGTIPKSPEDSGGFLDGIIQYFGKCWQENIPHNVSMMRRLPAVIIRGLFSSFSLL